MDSQEPRLPPSAISAPVKRSDLSGHSPLSQKTVPFSQPSLHSPQNPLSFSQLNPSSTVHHPSSATHPTPSSESSLAFRRRVLVTEVNNLLSSSHHPTTPPFTPSNHNLTYSGSSSTIPKPHQSPSNEGHDRERQSSRLSDTATRDLRSELSLSRRERLDLETDYVRLSSQLSTLKRLLSEKTEIFETAIRQLEQDKAQLQLLLSKQITDWIGSSTNHHPSSTSSTSSTLSSIPSDTKLSVTLTPPDIARLYSIVASLSNQADSLQHQLDVSLATTIAADALLDTKSNEIVGLQRQLTTQESRLSSLMEESHEIRRLSLHNMELLERGKIAAEHQLTETLAKQQSLVYSAVQEAMHEKLESSQLLKNNETSEKLTSALATIVSLQKQLEVSEQQISAINQLHNNNNEKNRNEKNVIEKELHNIKIELNDIHHQLNVSQSNLNDALNEIQILKLQVEEEKGKGRVLELQLEKERCNSRDTMTMAERELHLATLDKEQYTKDLQLTTKELQLMTKELQLVNKELHLVTTENKHLQNEVQLLTESTHNLREKLNAVTLENSMLPSITSISLAALTSESNGASGTFDSRGGSFGTGADTNKEQHNENHSNSSSKNNDSKNNDDESNSNSNNNSSNNNSSNTDSTNNAMILPPPPASKSSTSPSPSSTAPPILEPSHSHHDLHSAVKFVKYSSMKSSIHEFLSWCQEKAECEHCLLSENLRMVITDLETDSSILSEELELLRADNATLRALISDLDKRMREAEHTCDLAKIEVAMINDQYLLLMREKNNLIERNDILEHELCTYHEFVEAEARKREEVRGGLRDEEGKRDGGNHSGSGVGSSGGGGDSNNTSNSVITNSKQSSIGERSLPKCELTASFSSECPTGASLQHVLSTLLEQEQQLYERDRRTLEDIKQQLCNISL